MTRSPGQPTAFRHIPSERAAPPYFAGRKKELAHLRRMLEEVLGGEFGGGINLVTGVPGAGKTHLVKRFLAEVGKAPELGVSTLEVSLDTLANGGVNLLLRIGAKLGWRDEAAAIADLEPKTSAKGVGGSAFGIGVRSSAAKDHARHTMDFDLMLSQSADDGLWRGKALVLMVDEVQEAGKEHASVLKSLHLGAHGCPIMFVGAGLQHSPLVLSKVGISRVSKGIGIHTLSRDETIDAIHKGFELVVDEMPMDLADRLADVSQFFPRHVNGCLQAAEEAHLEHGTLRMDAAKAAAVALGETARETYYQGRLDAMRVDSPQLSLFVLLDALKNRDAMPIRDAKKLFADTEYEHENIVEEAIARGVLRLRDGHVDFGIPSFRSFMERLQREHATRFGAPAP